MANPNRTVAAFRTAKQVKVHESDSFGTRGAADAHAEMMKTRYDSGYVVRVFPFKIGPRRSPIQKFIVRVYEKVVS